MSTLKECKVVMLPTEDKKAPIYKHIGDNIVEWSTNLVYNRNWNYPHVHKQWQQQHLYILSDDEIKEGEWGMLINMWPVKIRDIIKDNFRFDFQNNKQPTAIDKKSAIKKIIATTDKSLTKKLACDCGAITYEGCSQCLDILPGPSQGFIKKYCELGGIDRVMVEYEHQQCKLFHTGKSNLHLKVSKDNTITIKPVKDSWNREEVIKKLKEFAYSGYSKEQVLSWTKKNL